MCNWYIHRTENAPWRQNIYHFRPQPQLTHNETHIYMYSIYSIYSIVLYSIVQHGTFDVCLNTYLILNVISRTMLPRGAKHS